MEEALIKRILPNSLEAEQSVIGSMIMDREAILVASEILTGEDFYQNQYGIIFDAMVEQDRLRRKIFRRISAVWNTFEI